MDLTFEKFDGRGRHWRNVIDKATGKIVGQIISHGVRPLGGGGISIWLFDGKYQGWVHSYEATRGFVLGVEAVLSHMTEIAASASQRDAA